MFHTTALYRPATGSETSAMLAEGARETAAQMRQTGARRAYFAGRSRTRAEWLAFAEYHERMVRGEF